MAAVIIEHNEAHISAVYELALPIMSFSVGFLNISRSFHAGYIKPDHHAQNHDQHGYIGIESTLRLALDGSMLSASCALVLTGSS